MIIYKRLLIAVAFFLLCFSLPISAQAPTRITKILSTTACPGAGCVLLDVSGLGSVGFQVAGTFVATVQIEGSIDNITYVSVACLPNGGSATVTSLTATGVWTCQTAGLRSLRWRVSGYTSGTATVTAQAIVAVARSLFPFIGPSVTLSGVNAFAPSPTTALISLNDPNFTQAATAVMGANTFGQLGERNVGGVVLTGVNASGNTNTPGVFIFGVTDTDGAGSANPPIAFRSTVRNGVGVQTTATSDLACFFNFTTVETCLASNGSLLLHTNTAVLGWSGQSHLKDDAGDGTLTLYNNAENGFTRLNFGGAGGAAAPSIKVNGSTLTIIASDDSAAGSLQVTSGLGVNATPGATGTLSLGAKAVTYNSKTTAGYGFPTILGENISSTQTANFTALTQSPGAAAGRWECSAVLTTTSSTNTGTLQTTLDYVDSQGTTHTADVIPLIDAAGAVAASKTSAASKEFYTIPKRFSVNNANTNIVLKVVITGSVSYTVSPRCWQEA